VLAGRDDNAGAVLVVDVGGATTDVYSAVSAPDQPGHRVVALPADRRTVEGDLGMRWSAPRVVAEAERERLIEAGAAAELAGAAERRTADVGWLPTDRGEADVDLALARLAVVLAVRRHLRLVEGQLGPRGAGLLVLSGGVFRHADPERLSAVERELRADPTLRPVLRPAHVVVDSDYVLAPAGLLAGAGHPEAADALLASRLGAREASTPA
jgi:uncharacterized protein (TIGR01319 family)